MSRDRPIAWTAHRRVLPTRADGSPNVRAFGPDHFDVVFQPIVDLGTGETFAHEALVRCRHPDFMDPVHLFTTASEQRACGHLGRSIRHVAFERHQVGPLFVNVHPDELASRWLVRPDDPMSFHPHSVYLEITETAAFIHYDLCMDVLGEVSSRLGAHLVVDDFGAGHSTMDRVLELRPSVVKLDGHLVRGIDVDRERFERVRRIVEECHGLGALVVAECVETRDELSAVVDAGADFVQGFLLARPSYPVPSVQWPGGIPFGGRSRPGANRAGYA